ncbi:MAG TPA: hypothetical protein VK421_00890 [Pyrinomonadaceae bacterium]|nr:hypothetical protein [Pyrinomonadaceae bacterium]
MAKKGLLCCVVLAGTLLLNPVYSTAQFVGRDMRMVTQGKATCVCQSEAAQLNEPRTYLNLELKISEGGSFSVVRAAELPGYVRLNSVPTSDYIYEVSNGQQTVAAFLRDDPFTLRGFADPSSPQGEKSGRQQTTTIIVNIPNFGLSMLEKCNLGFRLYRLRLGVKVDRIDADALLRLREGGQLTPVMSVPASKFTEALKKAAKARR